MTEPTKLTDAEDVFDAFIQGWVPQNKWDAAFKYAQSMLRHRPLVSAAKLAEVERERDHHRAWGDNMLAAMSATRTERAAARAERDLLRQALIGVMKFAKPTRGVFCSTECLGTCSECKAMQAAHAALAWQPAEKEGA